MARPEVTLGPLPRVRALRVGSWVEWLAEERLEQVRKVAGEAAYREQKRSREKAW